MASNNTQFITKGKVDLSVETPTITATATSSYVELKLKDIATENEGDIITLYMMVAPVDMSSSILTFTVSGNGGVSYSQTLSAGKDMVAGKAYNYALSLEKDDPHYVAVDLGLPSGLKWATFNVGASLPEEYGDYYAWGEIEPKNEYTLDNYEYYHFIKDFDADGFETEEEVWDYLDGNISGTNYDIAHQKWGGSWRMPTDQEFSELIRCCEWKLATKNTITGYKITGNNGNWIFMPSKGGYFIGNNSNSSNGYYWTGTLVTNSGNKYNRAWMMSFDSMYSTYSINTLDRYLGMLIRPVTE